eukprot:3332389-Rhodomonas_salina.2
MVSEEIRASISSAVEGTLTHTSTVRFLCWVCSVEVLGTYSHSDSCSSDTAVAPTRPGMPAKMAVEAREGCVHPAMMVIHRPNPTSPPLAHVSGYSVVGKYGFGSQDGRSIWPAVPR